MIVNRTWCRYIARQVYILTPSYIYIYIYYKLVFNVKNVLIIRSTRYTYYIYILVSFIRMSAYSEFVQFLTTKVLPVNYIYIFKRIVFKLYI